MSSEQIDLRGAVADDGETVLACPACDSTRVWARGHAGVHSRGRAADGRWRCKDCGETFDRKRRRTGLALRPPAIITMIARNPTTTRDLIVSPAGRPAPKRPTHVRGARWPRPVTFVRGA